MLALLLAATLHAEPVSLENATVKLVIDTGGGGIVDFQLKSNALNPFRWEDRRTTGPRPRGHFLCLDRWGQPSEAELKNGMPFHGEAPRVEWKVEKASETELTMSAMLPIAKIEVRRHVKIDGPSAIVTEWVTNRNPIGRIYNMVQHPSIGPPFLDETTVVDANARKGLMQSSPLPNPEEPAVVWPQALKDGQTVDMRHLTNDPLPNVVSYVIDEDIGWTTAVNPAKGLLLGYVWHTSDYPWFNAWRHTENGRPAARGLEFGTTGLHQPYPILVKKGSIFGRSLYDYLDASQTTKRQYQMFLQPVKSSHTGVNKISRTGKAIVLQGRNGEEIRVSDLLQTP